MFTLLWNYTHSVGLTVLGAVTAVMVITHVIHSWVEVPAIALGKSITSWFGKLRMRQADMPRASTELAAAGSATKLAAYR